MESDKGGLIQLIKTQVPLIFRLPAFAANKLRYLWLWDLQTLQKNRTNNQFIAIRELFPNQKLSTKEELFKINDCNKSKFLLQIQSIFMLQEVQVFDRRFFFWVKMKSGIIRKLDGKLSPKSGTSGR